jgi:hypothetical protein
MPALVHSFIKETYRKENYNIKYTTFIETGTWLGDTIFEMEQHFDKLYTIEINKTFYDNLVANYKNDKITFLLGASEDKLVEILPTINENVVFFLDGHWSAGDTGKGEKDVPLYEELTAINEHFKKNAIIIIDDVRLFGKGPNKEFNDKELCNWEEINETNLLNILENRTKQYYYAPSTICQNDRLVIHISEI